MKKLFLSALVAAVVLLSGGFVPQAKAAERVTKIVKTCKYSISGVTADAVLTQANGQGYCDVSDIVVDRVVLEDNVTTLTGTNVIFKAITTSDPSNAGGTGDPALVGSDGSTALVSATLTAAGRHARGTQVPGAGASGLNANLGTKIGVWADVSSISALDGYVYLTIFGRQ